MARPVSQMFSESMSVLTAPSVARFEEFERNGTIQDGFIYVAVAAALSALLGFLFSLFTSGIVGAFLSALMSFIFPLLGYAVFAYLVHYIGRAQGGTGTQDEVFYTIALYAAPLLALSALLNNFPMPRCLIWPLTLLLLLSQLYLTYLAVRAAMNLESTPAIITIVVAWIGEVIAVAIIGTIWGIFYGLFHIVAH